MISLLEKEHKSLAHGFHIEELVRQGSIDDYWTAEVRYQSSLLITIQYCEYEGPLSPALVDQHFQGVYICAPICVRKDGL